MSKKIQLSVLCGGQSPEHHISIQSAINVVSELDQRKYNITIIYIDTAGGWYCFPDVEFFLKADPQALSSDHQGEPITVKLGDSCWLSLNDPKQRFPVDCVFPVLHGAKGEDGVMQGLLTLLDLPYVGCSVLSSSLCMEKDMTKCVLRSANIPVVDWVVVLTSTSREGLYSDITKELGATLVIKPMSAGSSVGISKVADEASFLEGLDEAFQYDRRVLVESCIVGREIECAVLGNHEPQASKPGEIVVPDGFYSYFEKYDSESRTQVVVPADLPEATIQAVQTRAVQAFKALHCSGMARVDFFVVGDQEPMINEVNTIPGFTNISLYPKMWEATGLSYTALLDQLIELAFEKHSDKIGGHSI